MFNKLIKANMLKFPINIFHQQESQDYFGSIIAAKQEIWSGLAYTETRNSLALEKLANDIYQELLKRDHEIRLFWIRYNPNIKRNMWVYYKDANYQIKYLDNIHEKNHTLLLITIRSDNE